MNFLTSGLSVFSLYNLILEIFLVAVTHLSLANFLIKSFIVEYPAFEYSLSDNLVKGLSEREFSKLNITKDKIEIVLEALVKQKICGKKKKEHGWKYFLNMDRLDKIKEITKETGKDSIIPILLLLNLE